MHDLVNHLWQIDIERLDRAITALTRNAAHEQKRLHILCKLRKSGLVGRVFNRACIPALQELFPGYRVYISINDYSDKRWRCLYLTDESNDDGPREKWVFTLADKENTRLTIETLDQNAERTRKDLTQYSRMAAELPAQVAAYNAAAAYLKPIKDSISTTLYRAEDRTD